MTRPRPPYSHPDRRDGACATAASTHDAARPDGRSLDALASTTLTRDPFAGPHFVLGLVLTLALALPAGAIARQQPQPRQDEPSSRQDEPSSRQEEPSSRQEESSSRQEQSSSRQEELPLRRAEVPLELEECREVRRFDAVTYWFWDAYFGVTDVVERGPERQGRLTLDESICFRISSETLDDPVARTQGYRDAVDQLVQWVNDAPDSDDDPDSEAVRARRALREITGRRMAEGQTWMLWWNANRDYVWSADRPGRLEVVESAKAARAPMDEDALVLDAEEYWFYEGRGWISRLESRGEYLLGEVLIPPHGYGFRAHAVEIDDRGAKESGYLLALENLMVDGLMAPDLATRTARDLMARARALTGQQFESPTAWVGWWRDHQGRLALGADGQRLVTR